jgi:hypothetical protein
MRQVTGAAGEHFYPPRKLPAVPTPFEGEPQLSQGREKVRLATNASGTPSSTSDRASNAEQTRCDDLSLTHPSGGLDV